MRCSGVEDLSGRGLVRRGRHAGRFSFRWGAGCLPTLLSPEWEDIALVLKHNVPMLNSAHARPALEPMGGVPDHEPIAAERVVGGNPLSERGPTKNIDDDCERLMLHFLKRAECLACQHSEA